MRLTTDGNGNLLTQQGAFPFGESWYSNQGSGDNWVFTSYDRDSESGLDYALARYYDSRTGTFCSADPLAGDPSDPQSWNRYAYGRNDPIDVTDPSGKHWWSWLLDIGLNAADAALSRALFQSTPARGGRLRYRETDLVGLCVCRFCFNPRPRAAGDSSVRISVYLKDQFQSTPARGGRRNCGVFFVGSS